MGTERLFAKFNKKRVFLPVIHLPAQGKHGLEAVSVALKAGADGVFLINQGASVGVIMEQLIPSYRREFGSDLWIGVNFLGSALAEVMEQGTLSSTHRIDGIWTDNAGVDSLRADVFVDILSSVPKYRKKYKWDGIYFGGTAFKTQSEIPSHLLGLVSVRAASFMDVVCTSGRGTGVAADLAKIKTMRAAIPNTPMALASGITPDNVSAYLPYVEAYLVATGIEKEFGVLDFSKTKKLADTIHGYGE